MAYFLYASSACVAIFAIVILLLREKRRQQYFVAVSFALLSYILFFFAGNMIGLLSSVVPLFHSDIVVTFGASPAIYLAFMSIILEGERPARRYWPHFVAPVAAAIFFLASNLGAWAGLIPPLPARIVDALNTLCDFSFTFYFALALARSGAAWKRKEISYPRDFFAMVSFLVALFANSLFMFSAHFSRVEAVYYISAVLYAVIVIVFCLVTVRMHDYVFGRVKKSVPGSQLLKKSEIEMVRARLDEIMRARVPYRDPDLNLKSLSNLVGISPNQLSWYLNASLGMGFADYVNGFRLLAVERALLDSPDRPILEIAMENGFGSKASFNAIFSAKYGVSPREFRRRAAASRGD